MKSSRLKDDEGPLTLDTVFSSGLDDSLLVRCMGLLSSADDSAKFVAVVGVTATSMFFASLFFAIALLSTSCSSSHSKGYVSVSRM